MEGKILEMIEQEKEQESPYFIERCDADGTTYVIVGPDGDTLCDGDDFALEEAEYICEAVNTAYNAGRVSMDKTLESLRSQIPHPGDGSCDHCGRVPSVNIPTSLCRECRDGIKRAEKAELDLQRVEQERDAAREALRKYGQHARNCKGDAIGAYRCTCGFDAALASKAEGGERE